MCFALRVSRARSTPSPARRGLNLHLGERLGQSQQDYWSRDKSLPPQLIDLVNYSHSLPIFGSIVFGSHTNFRDYHKSNLHEAMTIPHARSVASSIRESVLHYVLSTAKEWSSNGALVSRLIGVQSICMFGIRSHWSEEFSWTNSLVVDTTLRSDHIKPERRRENPLSSCYRPCGHTTVTVCPVLGRWTTLNPAVTRNSLISTRPVQ